MLLDKRLERDPAKSVDFRVACSAGVEPDRSFGALQLGDLGLVDEAKGRGGSMKRRISHADAIRSTWMPLRVTQVRPRYFSAAASGATIGCAATFCRSSSRSPAAVSRLEA